MANKKTEYIIDVDYVIKKHNKENPDLLPMDRRRISEQVDCTRQILSDWKRGLTPKIIKKLKILADIGNCKIEDFLIEKK